MSSLSDVLLLLTLCVGGLLTHFECLIFVVSSSDSFSFSVLTETSTVHMFRSTL